MPTRQNSRKKIYSVARMLMLVAAFTCLSLSKAQSDTLWYSGDLSDPGGVVNGFYPDDYAAVYTKFTVTGGGWTVNSVFTNNLYSMFATVDFGAVWEIRAGVTSGDGGTLLFSGSTETPTVTPTGRTYAGGFYIEYNVAVTGLSLTLDDGDYWLSVTPSSPVEEHDNTYISITTGLNSVGVPPGYVDQSYFDSTTYDASWQLSTQNYSIGLTNSVPEPSVLGLTALGFFSLLARRRR